MAGRAGVASGLVLGLGFVTGAIGVPVMGAVADAFGMQTAMRVQVIVVAATIAVALFLPGEARLRALREERVPHADRTQADSPPSHARAASDAVEGR